MVIEDQSSRPKRILALDGGGVRGIVTIAFLERMEHELRAALGKPDLVLAEHFDLIGGTSVGSIIATMLALGWPMEKVRTTFQRWCPEIFGRAIALGVFRSRFDASELEKRLQDTLGQMTLADPALKTRLAIVTKRMDTGSPWWIVSNNPASSWWDGQRPGQRNKDLKLAELIRASTAAPTVFEPKRLPIETDRPYGTFIDGGVSPFNNPALALLMLARLKGHGLEWPLGPDKLQLISVGTGIWRDLIHYGFVQRKIAAWFGVVALRTMITDAQTLSLTILQWMSAPRRPWHINSEIGDMAGDVLGIGSGPCAPLIRFQRYDLSLEAAPLAPMMPAGKPPSAWKLQRLRSLDNPGELETLYQLAKKEAASQVDVHDFL